MNLALQMQTWETPNNWEQEVTSATPAEVDMQVDWVVAYAKSR